MVGDADTLDEGIALLRAALEVLPDDLTARSALEGALIRKQAWADLCGLYEEEIERDPPPARLYWLLTRLGAVAADRLGDRPRARQAFRRARELGEEGQELALARLPVLLEGESAREDAVELAGVLVQLAARERDITRKASLLEQAAGAYERHGIMDEALELYRQGVGLSPRGHPVQAAAGRAFIRAGLYDDLLALLDRATLSVAPSEKTLWLARSAEILARHLGRTEEAILRLRQVFELEPEHCAARQLLVGLLAADERWADLEDILSQSKATGPDLAVILMRRASLAEARGEMTLAAQFYGRALEEGVGCAGAAWARLTAAGGQWKALAEHYGSPTPGAFSPAHTRYRAAELYAERLDDRERALVHLEGLLVEQPGSITALLPLSRQPGPAARLAAALDSLAASTPDSATRVQTLGRLAAVHERLGQSSEAVAVREQLLSLQPRDLLIQDAQRSALATQGDRPRLAALLRVLAADTRTDAGTRSTLLVELAWVLEELGQYREAVDALRAAQQLEGDQPSLMARLTLPGLQEMLSDEPGHQAALSALAELLSGPERALCLRRLAERRLGALDLEGAAASFQAALAAHPADGETLLAMGALLDRLGRPEAFVDALMRAFAVEEDQARHAHIGVALTSRLIQAGRLGPARATVERLLALSPDDLRGLMLLAELDELEQRWSGAALGLRAVAAHAEASPQVRVRALAGMALVHGVRLGDPDGARQALEQLTLALPMDAEMLVSRLEVEQALQDHAAQATTLSQLAGLADPGSQDEGHFLLALARLQLEKLDQHQEVAVTLSRVRAPELRSEVMEGLVELATRHDAWERVALTLERILDEVVEAESAPGALIDPANEAALRRRLARLNEEAAAGPGSPERRARAVRHYARIVALGDRTTELLERLAELETDSDPVRAIAHHQALLLRGPDRLASYRALSRLFAATGDDDATFCAQAVLVGLGEADEEETYFYRQRRTRLRVEMATDLGDGDLALFCPELDEPAMQLLAVIDPHLGDVFPVDGTAYGPPGQPLPPSSPLRQVFDRVARLFSVEYQLRFISPNVGPTVEPARPPLVMLPRGLADNGEREHLFVAGLLLGRIALGGTITEPRRADAMTPRVLELLLQAACEIGEPTYVSPSRGKAMFGDLKQRLGKALGEAAREDLKMAVSRVLAEAGPADALVDAQGLLLTMNRATARVALLLAGDPATAVAWLKRLDMPLERPAGAGRGPSWMAMLPFVVSPEHLALRQRLGIQLRA
jgi:tetratricopeptide (TPR) repeat protein